MKSPSPTHQAVSGGLKIHKRVDPMTSAPPASITSEVAAKLSFGPRCVFVPVSISKADVMALLPHRRQVSVSAELAAPQAVHAQE